MKYLLNAYGIDIFSIIHQWHFDRLLNSDEKEALPLAPQAAGREASGGSIVTECPYSNDF
ncbi:hypothetical protein [Chromobacterium vaccinii]|uniref:hypothetical protein n=1 Tax=Chromobacterium vaccinii TaxID=1108595 RepID=UPI0011AB7009|nr:hypothetical protein [Chromobacterium vaccinii]